MPNANQVVRIAGEQCRPVRRPRHRYTLWTLALVCHVRNNFRLEFIHATLVLQVPNDNRRARCDAQPVAVGREAKRINNVRMVERVQMFAVVQVPKHRLVVLAAAGAQRTVGRHGHRCQIAVMANVICLETTVGQIPNLTDKMLTLDQALID